MRNARQLTQSIKDLAFFPLRLFLPYDKVNSLGLTSLLDERVNACLEYCRGRVLDVGCGSNRLISIYGNGYGVDIYPRKEVDAVCSATDLPFADASFDTVSYLACLNHIPDRVAALREANRVLRGDGTLLITMIDPIISFIGHKLVWGWWEPDSVERKMGRGETWGFWPSQIRKLLSQGGFELVRHQRFVYGLNGLYIARKKSVTMSKGLVP